MIICTKCGSQNKVDSAFCENCGINFGNQPDFQSFHINNQKTEYSDTQFIINPVNNQPYYSPGANRVPIFNTQLDQTGPKKISLNPRSLKFISLYEIILSLIIFKIGWDQYMNSIDKRTLYLDSVYNQTFATQYEIFALSFGLLALLGILAGFFLLLKKKIGYHLSRIYLMITGIVFCWFYLLTTIGMLISFAYFNTDDSIKFLFKKFPFQSKPQIRVQ